VAHVNQEIPMRYQVLHPFDAAMGPIPATCHPAHLGQYSKPRTIRGGDGGGAAFERFSGARELPLLAGQRPMAETAPTARSEGSLIDPLQTLAHVRFRGG